MDKQLSSIFNEDYYNSSSYETMMDNKNLKILANSKDALAENNILYPFLLYFWKNRDEFYSPLKCRIFRRSDVST